MADLLVAGGIAIKYKVLVADDNRDLCQELCLEIAANVQFEVLRPVYDGEGALALIRKYRPEILILDLILPVMDGIYLINYVHHSMPGYHPFIYVLSGIGTVNAEKIMQNLRVDFYSVKPISAARVAENLDFLWSVCVSGSARPTTASRASATEKPPENALQSIDISKQVDSFLNDLGASLYRTSTYCMRCALNLCIMDESKLKSMTKLYALVGQDEKINRSPSAVERNIRSVIKSVHNHPTEHYQAYFPDIKDKPMSNADFLNRAIYILRGRIENILAHNC